MSQADDPDLTRETDAVIGRADAFMRRRRNVPDQSHADDDIPLLTDIVPLSMPRSVLDELSDPAVFQRPHRGPEAEAVPERALDAGLKAFQAAAPEEEPEEEAEGDAELAPDFAAEIEAASEPDFEPEPEPEPDLEPGLAQEPEPEWTPEMEAEAEPEATEPSAPTEAPAQTDIETLVAARLQEVLGIHRQEMAIVLDDWLNFDLPRLVSREIDGIADRIVKIAGEELRILLQSGLPPEE